MKYRDLLFERHSDEMLMYHGTFGVAAKDIALNGLIADPPDRNYAASDSENYHLASLDGAYFTNTFEVAVGYAYKASHEERGDWAAIIAARVPLVEAVPDEDVITSAMEEAARRTRDPDAFAKAFHRNLVQNRPIPMQREMLLAVRDAFANLETVEDDEGLAQAVQHYRRALDEVTRAYAEMVFDTHPVYLGGNHTMRLPNGLPKENIVSITLFGVEFDEDEYPQVSNVQSMVGIPFTDEQIQEAIDQLWQRDFF